MKRLYNRCSLTILIPDTVIILSMMATEKIVLLWQKLALE